MREGADAFKAIGTEQSTGNKIYCVSGHVKRPGNYELPMSTTFRELLYEHAGGPLHDDRPFKAMLPSGGSGPIVPLTDEVLDTRMSYEDCGDIGTIIGSASIIVMDETVDMTWVASKVTKFFEHESCGKCTPCREGTYWLDKVIDRILDGRGTPDDVNELPMLPRICKARPCARWVISPPIPSSIPFVISRTTSRNTCKARRPPVIDARDLDGSERSYGCRSRSLGSGRLAVDEQQR